jgi:hypothetical protein
VEQEVDMNGEFAHTAGSSLASGQTTSAAQRVLEFMRWNDMTVTPSRLRPSLETFRIEETATRSDDDD